MAEKSNQDFSKEFKKQGIQLTVKWAFAIVVLLIGVALAGWWWVLKPWLVKELGGVPKGAVVAFDRLEGCPDGWANFTPALSRTIVGALGADQKFPDENNLTPRKFRDPDGEESHKLTKAEMPVHSHRMIWGQKDGSKKRSSANDLLQRQYKGKPIQHTLEEGGSKAHNNMAPYIPLYYCKYVG